MGWWRWGFHDQTPLSSSYQRLQRSVKRKDVLIQYCFPVNITRCVILQRIFTYVMYTVQSEAIVKINIFVLSNHVCLLHPIPDWIL